MARRPVRALVETPALVDALESRRLLSTAVLNGGLLFVTGTAGDNQITLTTVPAAAGQPAKVRVVTNDGLNKLFTLSAVTRVQVNAGAGHDVVNTSGVNKPTLVNGGPGNDRLTTGPNVDAINAGDGDDWMDGGLGADFFSGGNGRDRVSYATRTANLNVSLDDKANDGAPGEKDDVRSNTEEIEGGSGNDVLIGSQNPNVLLGGPGNDRLYGRGNADFLDGGAGNDQLYGEAGDDLLDGGTGTDYLSGGSGLNDTVSYALRTVSIFASIDGINNDGAAGEMDFIESDVEGLIGGSGNDTLKGNGGNNLLQGGKGNDLLLGGGGNDTLIGGPGADRLYGEAGDDTLFGDDGQADYLDGGLGNDKAKRDAIDGIFSIESFI